MRPFAIFALPRSRTAWVSRFLTVGPWVCVHDPMTQLDSAARLKELLSIPCTGFAETGMPFAAPVVRRFFPDCRVAVIRRDPGEVAMSLARHGIHFLDEDHLRRHEADLVGIASLPGAISVTFDELRTEDGCRKLWEHCLDIPFDGERWARMAPENIQIDLAERVQSLIANSARYEALAAELRSLTQPVTYRAERWAEFHPDCLPLFERHSAEVGEAHPEMPFDPNLDQAEALDRVGGIVFMTARAGARLVGYCVFIVAQSFESRHVLCGTQGIFYMLPEFRQGLGGVKLLRAAIEEMKRRGVKMLYFRHGLRGSSRKLGLLFQKLGAQDNGRDYSLWIGADHAA